MNAQQLSKLPGAQVEDNPYDIGYWSRIASLPRPENAEQRKGWDQADRELKDEQTARHA